MKHDDTLGVSAYDLQPPSGGCVLKLARMYAQPNMGKTAAFGRLCVETRPTTTKKSISRSSRLRAAVC